MKLSAHLAARLTLCAAAMLAGITACGDTAPGSDVAAHTEIPAEGTCEAKGLLKAANEATEAELDDDAGLDSRAAAGIVAARPFATLAELDDVAYVGASAMKKLLVYAETEGHLAVCEGGGCDDAAILEVANGLSQAELDDAVGLDGRAAANIVAERPFATLAELDEVSYVGQSALAKLLAYAESHGIVAACEGGDTGEIGIVSDLDKTVVPPGDPDLSVAPYPGVTKLYQLLERRNGGADGDMYFVTARTPDGVVDIPAYLEEHGVPAGPIETGVSGVPWEAEPEKVADVSRILDESGEQRFILFGDSSHRDPEVYKTIRATYGDRIIAGFIHKVNNTVSAHRVEGLHLHESYAEVAAILYGMSVLDRDEAKSVMESAAEEGLPIDDAEMEALLDQHAP